MARTIEEKKVYYVRDSVTGENIGPIHDKIFAQTLCNEGNQKHTTSPYSLAAVERFYGGTSSDTGTV